MSIPKNIDGKVGFIAGCMDLFHAGHVLALKYAKSNCDHLIVFLQTNPTLDRPSKGIPVQTLDARLIQLEGCKYVDDIVVYSTESELLGYLKDLKSRYHNRLVRFLGDDYQGKTEFTGSGLNIDIYYIDRSHGLSSTELKSRVILDQHRYPLRGICSKVVSTLSNIEVLMSEDINSLLLVKFTDPDNLTTSISDILDYYEELLLLPIVGSFSISTKDSSGLSLNLNEVFSVTTEDYRITAQDTDCELLIIRSFIDE